MVDAATYSAIETLRDGSHIEIRALRPEDRAELLTAVGRTSRESLYRRFFAVKRGFTEREMDYFLNIDFVNHIALVAVTEEANRPVIVGGARYIVMQTSKAELAFAVIDEYQGLGIGTSLMRHLALIARGSGIRELVAEVLLENEAVLRVFAKSGFPFRMKRESDVVGVSLWLDATYLPSPPSGQ